MESAAGWAETPTSRNYDYSWVSSLDDSDEVFSDCSAEKYESMNWDLDENTNWSEPGE